MKTLLDLMRRQLGPNVLDIKMLTLPSLVFVWSLQHSEIESKIWKEVSTNTFGIYLKKKCYAKSVCRSVVASSCSSLGDWLGFILGRRREKKKVDRLVSVWFLLPY